MSRPIRLFLIGIVLIVASVSTFYWMQAIHSKDTVVRAAIDVGSGGTKLRVAEVDLKSHKITQILFNQQFTVHYQEALSKSPDGTFDPEVMKTGMEAFKEAVKEAKKYGADKVVAIATAAFRKAKNGEQFADEIYKETGVKIYIVDQELEGELAFQAAKSQMDVTPSNLVVWDIGGGSLQMTSMTPEGEYQIYRGHEASVPFKNFVIENIQKRNIKDYTSPNPMTLEDISAAELHARDLAKKVDQIFKDKIAKPETRVVGVGSVFAYGIYDLVGKQEIFTTPTLATQVLLLAGKTDADFGGDFANVVGTNAILVLGFMEELGMKGMRIIDVNNADGALVYDKFWKGDQP